MAYWQVKGRAVCHIEGGRWMEAGVKGQGQTLTVWWWYWSLKVKLLVASLPGFFLTNTIPVVVVWCEEKSNIYLQSIEFLSWIDFLSLQKYLKVLESSQGLSEFCLKRNHLMAEIPDSNQHQEKKSIVPHPKAFMPNKLHGNPFIEFDDMLLTEGATNSRENITSWCRHNDSWELLKAAGCDYTFRG